jgi:SAM-dependent methyltransferase
LSEMVTHCLLCNSEKSRLYDQRRFGGQVVENRLCLSCGFVYQSPRMTLSEAASFYSGEYRQMYQGSQDPSLKDMAIQELRAKNLVAFTRHNVNDVQRFLDIGCSAGSLLKAFNQVYGCHPIGIEPGDAYRDFASKTGFKIYKSLPEMQNDTQQKFDLISMSHVLEHLPDPLESLIDIRTRNLESEGWLLIEVPNIYSHDSFEVAHLSSFSSHTLNQLVQKAGYKVIRLEKHGKPRSSMVPYYLTALCKPSLTKKKFFATPERGVISSPGLEKIGIARNIGQIFNEISYRWFGFDRSTSFAQPPGYWRA